MPLDTKLGERLSTLFLEQPCWMIESLSRRIAVFDSIGSAFSCRSWILQQFHPQWRLVYASFDPSFRPRRPVVLQRHRLLACRQPDQYSGGLDHSQRGRHDRRAAWREAPLQVPFGSRSAVEARETPTGEDRAFSRIPCHRSTHCSRPAPERGEPVGRALYTQATFVRHMGVDHCGLDAPMSRQFLDGPDVMACIEQMGRERMPERMRTCGFIYPRLTGSIPDRSLQNCLTHIMPPLDPRSRVSRTALRRKLDRPQTDEILGHESAVK